MRTTRLHVTLHDVEPRVRRVLDVPAVSTLPEVHLALQAAFGWWNCHLHQFVAADGRQYGMELPDGDAPDDQLDEATATLRSLGGRFSYEYDFGDGWAHDVEVLGAGGERPGCVNGEGSCPPENCGGPGGYARLLAILADPRHPEHEDASAWVGKGLRPFDLAETDAYIVRMVGVVPRTVRLLLDLIGDGVKLTARGWLPRSVVHEMQRQYPSWYGTDAPVRSEDDLWPLAELRELLRRAGLLRVRAGTLVRTKAADDAPAVVRRLRSSFPGGPFEQQLAELVCATLAARGSLTTPELAEALLPELGRRWAVRDRPLTARDLASAIRQVEPLLTALDLVERASPKWTAGPSATDLLPGATLRAHVWALER